MTDSIYANSFSQEDTATTIETVIELPWPSRRIIITNDGSNDLRFFFKNTDDYITLKGTETMSIDRFRTETVKVQTVTGSVPYRLWVFG